MNMMKPGLPLVIAPLLVVCACVFVFAQPKPRFRHINRDQGLSSNRILCITQDRFGFMWFGTEDGLTRYDGSDFEIYKHDPRDTFSLSDNTITCLTQEHESGNFWIGTRYGVNYYNRRENKFYRHPLNFNKELAPSGEFVIRDILIDHKGGLWIGTTANGAYYFKSPTDAPVNYKPGTSHDITDLHVHNIYEAYDHTIWAGTHTNLCRLNTLKNQFTVFKLPKSKFRVLAIGEDSSKNLWISTRDHGIFRISPDDSVKHLSRENGYLKSNRVYGIAEDENKNIWIAVRDGGGIHLLNTATDSITLFSHDLGDPESLSSGVLNTIYKDRNGNIWIGTAANGVDYYDRQAKQFGHVKASRKPDALINNNVRAVYEDSRSNIWIGTVDGGGLSKFNPRDGSFKNYRSDPAKPYGLNDGYILCITEASPGKLIIGTYHSGISIFDQQQEKFFNVKNSPENNVFSRSSVYHVTRDRYDSIWTSSYNNVYTFDVRTQRFKKRWAIMAVKDMFDYSDDEVYFLTVSNGLYRVNRKTNTQINYNKTNSDLSDNYVHSIARDSQGMLWIATSNGINVFDPKTGSFKSYNTKDGLPNNFTCGVLIDDHDHVWISTVNGLAKFDPVRKKFMVFDVHDGLQGNEFERFVCKKLSTGEMIFAGRNGFNYFHPENIRENPITPPVVITDLLIFNKPVFPNAEGSPLQEHISLAKKITLNYQQNVFSFQFVAINFTAPQKNQYAYKLEGFDKDWILTTAAKRYATYTSLPAGTYHFKVKASNNDGLWNDEPTSVTVSILPPPWKTTWAYIFYIILVSLLIYFFLRYINMRRNFKMQLEVARLEKEKIEELNRMKVDFFTNISHEFKTPLTLIIGALKRLTNNVNEPSPFKNEVGYIHRNTLRLQNLIGQLIDFRKIESKKLTPDYRKGDMVAFLKELLSVFQPIADENDIELVFDNSAESINTFFDADKTEKIFYNLISNAVKFTPVNGSVTVLVKLYNHQHNAAFVSTKITNTGAPIEQHVLPHIFDTFYHTKSPNSFSQPGTGIGLAFVKELVSLLNGKIMVDSDHEETSFTVHLPYIEDVSKEANIASVTENKFEYSQELVKALRVQPDLVGKSGNIKGAMLLIVEDEPELREYLFELFAEEYKVITAADGQQGFELATREYPELILSDILMPKASGIDLCHKIKSDITTSHIPVILLTASNAADQKIKGMQTGADVYIEKPFDADFLKLQVNNVIQTRKAIRQAFAKKVTPEPEHITITSTDEEFVKKAIAIVEENMDNTEFDVDAFVKSIGMGRTLLYRKIKALTDLPVNDFILNIRLKRALQLLKDSDLTISEIADKVGFSSAKYFSVCFKRFFKESPSQVVEKHRSELR